MRLYAAINMIDPPAELYEFGQRNILTSFSYHDGVRGGRGFQDRAERVNGFWIGARQAVIEAMRIYHAQGRRHGLEAAENYLAGCDNVLLSYVDHDVQPKAFEFWLDARRRAMKLYIAGNGRQAESDLIDYRTGARNRLLSYAFIDDWADLAFQFWVEERPESASVFLDSGAFSAMSRGSKIDMDKYCTYIEQHKDALACYAALDVIGDWRATAVNLDAMLQRGLQPIPCFHRGSPWGELDRIAKDHKHIALGGMVGGEGKRGTTTEDDLSPHLDHCFAIIKRHWPVKVHVFGVVAQWVLEKYPLYSADSSSAIMGAGMGRVSQFKGGRLRSLSWTEYGRDTHDGAVMDGVGRTGGKSQSAHPGRRKRNIEAMLALERYVTDLWTQRGVTWES